ncbi:hypothetical protein CGZ65_11570 [Neisseria weixii]|nr:hypothetical protein CGZ65_11570 [Neisseria weixii]
MEAAVIPAYSTGDAAWGADAAGGAPAGSEGEQAAKASSSGRENKDFIADISKTYSVNIADSLA